LANGLPLKMSEQIQGNVLSAFNKDHMSFLLVNFNESAPARRWLGEVEPLVATTRQVEGFNEAFGAAKKERGGDDPPMKAVWVNVGLTIDGLRTLSTNFQRLNDGLRNPPGGRESGFEAFRGKPRDADRAGRLGDVGRSAPENWVFGGPDQTEVDAVVTVAADDPDDLETKIDQIQEIAARHRVVTVLRLKGGTLPGARQGHEHFGFKDGISQPGVRQFHEPDPDNPDEREGHPGTEMIKPGEFVLGYPDEHGRDPDAVPGWMKDGSFQVLRRLAQDVPGWWAQMRQATAHHVEGGEDRLAAKAVGRWRSGTPLAAAPNRDNRSAHAGSDDNDFDYDDDPQGMKTPRFAHIRKTYPRDDRFQDDQHRIMRRGIPFGRHFDPALGRGHGQDAGRGLLFNAHCADISEQFEFIQEIWVNNVNFQETNDGPDPVIGTSGEATLHMKDSTEQLDFKRFVHTTGALYAFAPSKRTLQRLASGDL
jgi:Dyp-type peroxidase family